MRSEIRAALLFVLALPLASLPAPAQQLSLLPSVPGDLVPAAVQAAPDLKTLPGISSEPVSYAWALDSGRGLEPALAPPATQSRAYWQDVTGDELERGVRIHTLAPGALVRLNPAPGTTARSAPDPGQLLLTTPAGAELGNGAGFELVASPEALGSAPFPTGTSAFRLLPELGAGSFTLRAPEVPAGLYVVHVLDAGSDVALRLGAGASAYLAGDTLTVSAAFLESGTVLPPRQVDGFVTTPGGRVLELGFEPRGDAWTASLPLEALESGIEGLWEVHALARGTSRGLTALRGARVPFAVAAPTARLGEAGAGVARDDGVEIRLAVEVAEAGRYEVRGTLHGSGPSGELVPVALAQSAAWLGVGEGSLALRFEEALLQGHVAPFELRDLRLTDQSRLGLLEVRQRALRFE